MKIIARDIPPRAAWALEQAGIHPLLARLYAARGVLGKDELDDGLLQRPGGARWNVSCYYFHSCSSPSSVRKRPKAP